jgi:hypothetical protein
MYYRDLTRAAPIVQREIDLVHTAAAGDPLTMYLWWMTRVPHRPTRNTIADCRYVSPLASYLACPKSASLGVAVSASDL